MGMNQPHRDILAALRDFFAAGDADKRAEAFRNLTGPAGPSLSEDWNAIEYAYNRLFVGPAAPIAPPFASVYLEPEPRLMGETTVKVGHFRRMIGLLAPFREDTPEDHIAGELDICVYLRDTIERSNSTELKAAYAWFLGRHMAAWIPQFLERVRSSENIPGEIVHTCAILQDRLLQELNWVRGGDHDTLSTPQSGGERSHETLD